MSNAARETWATAGRWLRRRMAIAAGVATVSAAAAGAAVPVTTVHAASSTCSTTILYYEYVGRFYLGVTAGSSEVDICLATDLSPLSEGGVLAVSGTDLRPVIVDGNAAACQSDLGYKRVLGGTVLTTPFFVDVATPSSTSVEVCASIGTQSEHLVISGTLPTLTMPTFTQEASFPTLPSWPTTGPSSSCAAAGFSRQIVITPDESFWSASGVSSGGSATECIRIDGPVSFGGVLTYPDIIDPLYYSPYSPTDCPINVVTLTDPFPFTIAVSDPTQLPFHACLSVREVTVSDGVPTVGWTPDPGTPG